MIKAMLHSGLCLCTKYHQWCDAAIGAQYRSSVKAQLKPTVVTPTDNS